MPFLHDKPMGDAQPVEDQVEHLDIIAGRIAVGTEEFKGLKIPVADNDKRVIVGIAVATIG
jgi:hypothetical protein